MGVPATRAEDHRNTWDVPCSPTTWASTCVGFTFNRRARCSRKRSESRNVPVLNTLSCPASVRARSASGSGGSVTTSSSACGATRTTCGTMSRYTPAFVSSRRSRPAASLRSVAPPAFSLIPAVIITSTASARSA